MSPQTHMDLFRIANEQRRKCKDLTVQMSQMEASNNLALSRSQDEINILSTRLRERDEKIKSLENYKWMYEELAK